jgi:glutamyl-tRNA reductase
MSNVSKDFNKVRAAIDDFAKNIAQEVADIRYYEVDKIKAIAATRLNFAVQELLQMQFLDYEQEKAKLVDQYIDPHIPNWKKEKLKRQITALNLEMKQNNRLRATFADYNELRQLSHYIIDKYGKEVLHDFRNNYLNKGENATHIRRRTGNQKEQ